MPLTEQEREWMERRKNLCGRCMYSASGRHCGMCDENFYAFDPGYCNDGFIAAEFEARVAAMAAQKAASLMQEESAWHVIRDCRLAVEQEMEKC